MHLFAKTDVSPPKRHFHSFACPVYVLDSALQQGKGYSKRKWTERARVGLYLGPSPQHARSIHLVLNLETGLVSPQFHVSFDDHFETTRKGASVLLPASKWQEKAHFVEVKSIMSPPKEPSAPKPIEIHAGPLPSVVPANERDTSIPKVRWERLKVVTPTAPINDNPTSIMEPPTQELEQSPIMTRSGRIIKPPTRLIEVFDATLTSHEEATDPELANPIFAFAASTDPDTMYLKEAMRQPDREKFIEAMKKEINDHTDNKHWRIVHRSTIPKGTPILPQHA
jgi:hypothetical protein